MSTVWSSRGIAGNADLPLPPEILQEEGVILMHGKNTFGDKVYCFLKITLGNLREMRGKLFSGEAFSPSDYGTVVAAGKGEPTEEVKAEVAATYGSVEAPAKIASVAAPQAADPQAPKDWDEY